MTSPTSGRFGSRDASTDSGFTLIELLVVIGVIALLASVILVAVNRASKSGTTIKAKADLQSIATALEAYKQDFGGYPLVTEPNSGAAVLCKALLGPSPKPRSNPPFEAGEVYQQVYVPPATPPATYVALVPASAVPPVSPAMESDWIRFNTFDGADGTYPDFREIGNRVGPKVIDDGSNGGTPFDGVGDRPGGKVFGPYVQPEKFKVGKDSLFFADAAGKPILYFPAAALKPKLATIEGPGSTPSPPGGYVSNGPGGLFDARDNIRLFMRKNPPSNETTITNALARIRVMIGDFGCNGASDAQFGYREEENAAGLPYLLWMAGPDGNYGPSTDPADKSYIYPSPGSAQQVRDNERAAEACDDISNFQLR